jgi:hypothetical protein
LQDGLEFTDIALPLVWRESFPIQVGEFIDKLISEAKPHPDGGDQGQHGRRQPHRRATDFIDCQELVNADVIALPSHMIQQQSVPLAASAGDQHRLRCYDAVFVAGADYFCGFGQPFFEKYFFVAGEIGRDLDYFAPLNTGRGQAE